MEGTAQLYRSLIQNPQALSLEEIQSFVDAAQERFFCDSVALLLAAPSLAEKKYVAVLLKNIVRNNYQKSSVSQSV